MAECQFLRRCLRHVELGQQRRYIHHGNDGRSRSRRFARKQGAVCHHSTDRAAQIGIACLRFRVLQFALGRGQLALSRQFVGTLRGLCHAFGMLQGRLIGCPCRCLSGHRGVHVTAGDRTLLIQLFTVGGRSLRYLKGRP